MLTFQNVPYKFEIKSLNLRIYIMEVRMTLGSAYKCVQVSECGRVAL